jgi:holin-like protein
MKYLIQFLIIIAFAFVGEVLHFLIPIPVPASIYGIILLFAALEKKWVKVKDIREVSVFLIAIMPVMFIPSAVGLIDSWEAIRSSIIQYIAVILLTTVVVMGCAGFVTQYVIRKGKEKKK